MSHASQGEDRKPDRVSRTECWSVMAFVVLMGVFFWWTMSSTKRPWRWGGPQRDYYTLLVHGWLDGHLHMKADVPEALLRIADPYDPTQRPTGLGLHDATFYQGKYYIYFGVAPAVVLMLPFRVLTGVDLPAPVAVWLFVFGGYATSVAVWWQVRTRYFRGASALSSLAGVAMLGLVGLGPVLLRRPTVYELAIAGAYFFAMTAVYCGFRSLHAVRRQVGWLAAASVAAGLAVGSRPSYVIGAPVLIAVLWWWQYRATVGAERRCFAVAALGPLGLCAVALALHNYLRFGDPAEFGVRYMFSGVYESRVTHFSVAFMARNFWSYFLSVPEWKPWFPFIESKGWPAGPVGYMVGDGYYGVLSTMPVMGLGPVALALLWWRARADEARLRAWLLAVFLLGGGTALLLTGFYASAVRYQVDFAPALALAGGVGVLLCDERLAMIGGSWARRVGRSALVAIVMGSIGFGLLVSFQTNNEFRGHNPAGFREIAAWCNVVPAKIAAWRGIRFGAVELRVQLPEGRSGRREPLVTTGATGRGDFLMLEYLEGGCVRFGFESWGSAPQWSEPVAVNRGAEHRVEIGYGALFGPPVLGREHKELDRRVQVKLDGKIVWEREADSYPAEPREVYIGANPIGGTGCAETFSGTILEVVRGGKPDSVR